MRSGFARRHRVGFASGVVVVAAVIAVVVYALAVPGYEAHKAKLNDGGVWVTKNAGGLFGRLNKPISQLDGFAYANPSGTSEDSNLDVLQDGAAVVGIDSGSGALYPIDPTTAKPVLSAKVPLPAASGPQMYGGTLATIDAKGGVRASIYDPDEPLAQISGLAVRRPLTTVAGAKALTIDADGTVYAVAPGSVTTVPRTGAGFGKPTTRSLPDVSGALTATTVGTALVVLASEASSSTSTLILPNGGRRSIDASGLVLQQPSVGTGHVLLANTRELFDVNLQTGAGSKIAIFSGGTGKPAQPVQLSGCWFAAWAGTPTGAYAKQCQGASIVSAQIRGGLSQPKFRVNRQQIMLNDEANGFTFNLDGTPRQVANWAAVVPPPANQARKAKNDQNNTDRTRAQRPKAADHTFGARPGTTTALYVLDFANDPSGEPMSVDSFQAESQTVSRMLAISPDGQTVNIAVPPGYSQTVRFQFTIGTARGGTSTATATVEMRSPEINHPPTTRNHYTAPRPTVAEGGTVTVPVLSDWRDYLDGDAVVLTGASAAAGQASTTPDGELVYQAPEKPGPQTVNYQVSDGRPNGVGTQHFIVQVQRPSADPVAATAEPDYARGLQNKPISIFPLDNDLAGSDPLNPGASLQLAAPVASPSGVRVSTDLPSGEVTVVSSRPGLIPLQYSAKYGNAPAAQGVIDVRVDGSGSQSPVTAPDVAVLHGQVPVSVDVLANDSDPAGNLLVVQRAVADRPSDLNVAVVGGRYLEISAAQPTLSQAVETIDYTVTDGVTSGVTGTVTVTQLKASATDTPIPLEDFATVRSGEPVAIPVLDNDTSPNGGPLSLVTTGIAGVNGGEYPVRGGGSAFASGRLVRYLAPAVSRTTTAFISYEVQNQAGTPALGTAEVTITPPQSTSNPDRPPTPRLVEERTVAGETVTIKIPTSGVDPDGDPVTVTAIGATPPTLGRVLAVRPTSIDYQAYPNTRSGGTDTFGYVVTDQYGESATGTVRVAVVPSEDPQPPVAVDDTVTVSPDAVVSIDVLANDLVAAGDDVTISPLGRAVAAQGVKIVGGRFIEARAPEDQKRTLSFPYTITDGLHSSQASVTVHAEKGIDLPPVVFDQFATPKPNTRIVSIDLLRGDYDPDSPTADLHVAFPPGATATGYLPITLRAAPQVIPFVVVDAQGAKAAAAVYVPAFGRGAPMLRQPVKIATVKKNGSTTIDINNYVIDPAGKTLHVYTTDTVKSSPDPALTAVAVALRPTQLRLTAGKNYVGPAAVTLEVTDGQKVGSPGANVGYVTIPVQVGAITPVLNCPATAVSLAAGGRPASLSIPRYCHVWMPTAQQAAAVEYQISWQHSPAGVSLKANAGRTGATLLAAGSATPGDGTLLVRSVKPAGAKATVNVHVAGAQALSISPIQISGLDAGVPKSVDVSPYVTSPLLRPELRLVGTPKPAGRTAGLKISAHGTTITVTPSSAVHGTFSFSFVATDAPHATDANRRATGTLTVGVLGRPGKPVNVQPGKTVLSGAVDLSWTAAAPNGAPIDDYLVQWAGGQQHCGNTNACTITGLQNGKFYTFTVTAYNAVGHGDKSAPSPSVRPNAVPTTVRNFVAANPLDHSLTLSWQRDLGPGYSAVTGYKIVGGLTPIPLNGNASTYRMTGLQNDQTYTFQIEAENAQGLSEPATASGVNESAGKPTKPAAPNATTTDDPSTNNRVVSLSWPDVDRNGPGPVTYTVTRTTVSTGASTTLACLDPTAPACADPNVALDGDQYTYSVTAHNAAGSDPQHTSPASDLTTIDASGTPGPISNPQLTATGNNDEATLTFDAPPSHGGSSTITCTITGVGPCGNWTSSGYNKDGQHISQTITGFSNGQSSTVTLQECNGSSGTNHGGTPCDSQVQSTETTTYGTIGTVAVNPQPGNGQNAQWSVTVDPNGKSAHVVVTSNHGFRTEYDTGVSEETSQVFSENTGGYDQADEISVSVSGDGRSGSTGPTTARSADPPPASIAASESSGYMTGSAGSCTSSTDHCHGLNVTVQNFQTGYFHWSCQDNDGTYFTSTNTIHVSSANQSFGDVNWCLNGYPNETIRITINGVQSNGVSE